VYNPVQLWGWVRGQRRRIQFSFWRSPQISEIKDIIGVPTSFQAEVLAKQYGIPFSPGYDHIDIAIDGADEVDPQKNLIKGGGAAHTREENCRLASRPVIVVV